MIIPVNEIANRKNKVDQIRDKMLKEVDAEIRKIQDLLSEVDQVDPDNDGYKCEALTLAGLYAWKDYITDESFLMQTVPNSYDENYVNFCVGDKTMNMLLDPHRNTAIDFIVKLLPIESHKVYVVGEMLNDRYIEFEYFTIVERCIYDKLNEDNIAE